MVLRHARSPGLPLRPGELQEAELLSLPSEDEAIKSINIWYSLYHQIPIGKLKHNLIATANIDAIVWC